MSELITKLKGAATARLAAEKAAMEVARQTIKPILQEFMKDHPTITAIGWTQYTPYFNDGEACEFRVGSLTIADSTADLEGSLYDDGWYEVYGKYTAKDRYYGDEISSSDAEAAHELGSLLDSMEAELLAVFGDHVKVVVTKHGVEVDDYDHD